MVVAIIGLLVAVLAPALAKARFQAKVAICQSNLHQVGLGIATYAQEGGRIPFGPSVAGLPPFLEANDGTLATNQIWTGPQQPMKERMALGLLLGRPTILPAMLYCPGDDSSDPQEELAKLTMKKISPAYSSYLYRQLFETNHRGKLEDLGRNTAGAPAAALAIDVNSLITVDPSYYRTNHRATRVNILTVNGSVLTRRNNDNRFSLRDQDLADLVQRRREIFQHADAGAR